MDGTQNTYTASFAGDPSGGLVNNEVTGTAPGGSPGGGGPTGVMPTPADSIEEFRVGTNNQTADFNSSAGAQVRMVTKRGTNQWHGTAYEYYLDNNWAANTFNNNATGNAEAQLPLQSLRRFGRRSIVSKGRAWWEVVHFCQLRGLPLESVDHDYKGCSVSRHGLGILQFGGVAYNLNPNPVTYNGPATSVLMPGQVVAPAVCPAGPCDPHGLGISPTVQSMWTQFMPASNTSSCSGVSRCDHLNVLAFAAICSFHGKMISA